MNTATPLLDLVIQAIEDMKGKNIATVDIAEVSSVADHMVIVSGTSNRHVKAIAGNVVDEAKTAGNPPIGVEGEATSEWILVDLGDVVVHVMLPATREYYDLERLWQHPQQHPDRAPSSNE